MSQSLLIQMLLKNQTWIVVPPVMIHYQASQLVLNPVNHHWKMMTGRQSPFPSDEDLEDSMRGIDTVAMSQVSLE